MELAVKLLCVAPLPTLETCILLHPSAAQRHPTTPLRNWPAIKGTGLRLAEGAMALAVCQRHRMTITTNSRGDS